MPVPVAELIREYIQQVQVPRASAEQDSFLQRLVDDFQSSSSLFKRDMRRLMEQDPVTLLRSACRVLKTSAAGPGAVCLMELLWSSPVLVASLMEPAVLPLSAAITLARRWARFDPMLDIKLLHVGFPSNDSAVSDVDIARAKRVLAIVGELPANRHILLPLSRLIGSPDPYVRSKATSLYGRTSKNPDWVRKRLADSDARVRANAIESLWHEDSPAVRSVFMSALSDPHHRVAANALIGLHYTGTEVTANLHKMASGAEPLARAAAAFAMGMAGNAVFEPVLEGLLRDRDAHVRRQALRALIRIRRKDRHESGPPGEPPQRPAAQDPAGETDSSQAGPLAVKIA